jgi:hypothetical protein
VGKKELYGLYPSPNITLVIKSIRMRQAVYVASMERGEVHAGFRWRNLRETNHVEDLDIDGRIILKRIFKQ